MLDAARILHYREVAWRLAVVAGMIAVLVALRLIDPAASSWFPLRTSCGAITGLPCLFCGTTRAMHHLLNGDISRAIYFNWLAIPVFVAAVILMLMIVAEAALGRRLLQRRLSFRLTPRRLCAIVVVIVALWAVQITLAVRLHKHELLNPAGPLYAWFVR